MTDKLIVTNRAALRAKYGAAGLGKVVAAVAALTAADKKRGLDTRFVDLSTATAMARLGAPTVLDALNPKQNKDAIDALFRALDPDYLLLLGSIDVIPHQDLDNPVYADDKEDDATAWSDLPYACDAPYSRDIADFVGPTRVVARLPDLTGAREPSHLLALLGNATRHRERPLKDYLGYFGLSVRLWQQSTAQSLVNIFGNDDSLALCPPSSAARSRALGRLSHFINCHGGLADPQFYGEYRGKYPVAMHTRHTRAKIAKDTIAAVECCYGAELYDAAALGIDEPICQSYLRQGASAYFGSTTIAYGPAHGNGAADLITQYFLREVHGGASIGHAALEARQAYVRQANEMDPIDLKTLAQFCIYGDPSVHPVERQTPTSVPHGIAAADAHRHARAERRMKSRQSGEMLQQSKPTASRASRRRPSPGVEKTLMSIVRGLGLRTHAQFMTFEVSGGGATGRRSLTKTLPRCERYHVMITAQPGRKKSDLGSRIAIVAKEAGARVIGYRVYLQR
jgi:hypothetical protein